MTRSNTIILLLLGAVTLLWVSGGSAQQDSVGALGATVQQDDLDSYWLDSHNWYWYGYRPYTKAHISRFAPGLPTYYSGNSAGYSFGMNESAGNAPWEGGPPVKFQLSKYGTWH